MQLIDAIPTSVNPSGSSGWCFLFGEDVVGQEVGAAYLLPRKQYYVRFKVIDQDGIPAYQPISERPLTMEEVEHFERLALEYAQDARQHGEK